MGRGFRIRVRGRVAWIVTAFLVFALSGMGQAQSFETMDVGGIDWAISIGRYLRNDGQSVVNTERLETTVLGTRAAGFGFSVLGSGNTLENTAAGEGFVYANGGEAAVAVGMGAFDRDGGDNMIRNDGTMVAMATTPTSGARFSAALGMVATGSGNTLVSGVEDGQTDEDENAGGNENGEQNSGENGSHQPTELFAIASGTNSVAAGMVVIGQNNAAYNFEEFGVQAVATQSGLAVGMLSIKADFDDESTETTSDGESGDVKTTLFNRGGMGVIATGGPGAAAGGMVSLGNDARLVNEWDLDVEALSSDRSSALGMVAVGSGNKVQTAYDGWAWVSSTGTTAVSAGMAALGTNNVVENHGWFTVEAKGRQVPEGGQTAFALGLAAVDVDEDGTSAVFNYGKTRVYAHGGVNSRYAGAVGMLGVGSYVELVNREPTGGGDNDNGEKGPDENDLGQNGGDEGSEGDEADDDEDDDEDDSIRLRVVAEGTNALATGMWLASDGGGAQNNTGLKVTAEGTERAVALGMAAAHLQVGEDGPGLAPVERAFLHNDGGVDVTASGDEALGVGMVAFGPGSYLVNEDPEWAGTGLAVTADGERAMAVGMVVLGDGGQADSEAHIEVTANGGVRALAVGMAAADLDNDNDFEGQPGLVQVEKVTLTNSRTMNVAASGEEVKGIGLIAIGEDNALNNFGITEVTVEGGATGVAVGMAAFGENAIVENEEQIASVAMAREEAIAIGLSVSSGNHDDPTEDARGNTVRNSGYGLVSAERTTGGPEVEWADATGVYAEGDGNDVENAQFGTIWVNASGTHASATGVRAEGRDNTVNNDGTLNIDAVGASAHATGMAAGGADNHLINNGMMRVEASSSEPGDDPKIATGMFAAGQGNTLTNTDSLFVTANGDEAEAIGFATIGAQNVLSNTGSMTLTASGDGAEAIGFVAVGTQNNLFNSGTLTVNATGDGSKAVGMIADGHDNVIDVQGSIRVNADGASLNDERIEATGVLLWGTGSIANSNDHDGIWVQAEGEQTGAAGLVAWAEGGQVTVSNSGLVQARGTGDALGAYLVASTNSTADPIVSSDDEHVIGSSAHGDERDESGGSDGSDEVNQTVVVLDNAADGIIQAWATSETGRAVGVALNAPSEGTGRAIAEVRNRGIIGGYSSDATATVAIAIQGDRGAEEGAHNVSGDFERITIVNEGRLEGAVDLSAASGKVEVHLFDDSRTLGDVHFGRGENEAWVSTGGAAGLEGRLIGGDGEHARNTLYLFRQDGGPDQGDIADKLTRFETIEILSGRWSMDQEGMGERSTIVDAGATLRLSDTLHLGSSGRLGGNGAIEGDVVNEEGTVAAGMSIGELTIIGDYTHGHHAVLEVETRAENGRADKVIVTGTATLQGGIVNVLPEDAIGEYRGQTSRYTILEAHGGVIGEFAGSVSSAPLFLRSALSYEDGGADPDAVILELTGLTFSDLANTPNETSIAVILDDLYDQDPDASLVKALYSFASSSESEFRAGLNSMSGEVYTAFPVVSVAAVDRFAAAVAQGMNDPGTHPARVAWVSAYGTRGTLKGNDDNAGADVNVSGRAVGMHVMSGTNGRVGFTAGLTRSKVDMAARASSMNGEGYQFGVYGQYERSLDPSNTLRLTGIVIHGRSQYDVERHVVVGVGADRFSRKAEGEFGGTQVLASLRGEVLERQGPGASDSDGFVDVNAIMVQPVFGVSWLRTSRDGFTEKGADDANLTVDEYTQSYLRGDVGLRIAMRPIESRGGWSLNPIAKVAYVHDFAASGRDVTLEMAANPGTRRTIRGVEQGHGGFHVGMDLSGYRLSDERFEWNVQYEGEFRSHVQTHTIQGGLSYRF